MKKFLSRIGFGLFAMVVCVAALCFVVGVCAFIVDVVFKGQIPTHAESIAFIWFCVLAFIVGVEIYIGELE